MEKRKFKPVGKLCGILIALASPQPWLNGSLEEKSSHFTWDIMVPGPKRNRIDFIFKLLRLSVLT